MGFSPKQTRALGRRVPMRNVKLRVSAGKELSYIEGWYVLAEANRIFGFDGRDRETIETKCVSARDARGSCSAVYLARVRISVRAEDRTIVRDGHGTGEAFGNSAGEVHDRALKAAETDATKRALATFGKAFGLALHVGSGPAAPPGANAANTRAALPDTSPSGRDRPTIHAPPDLHAPPATAPAERDERGSAHAENVARMLKGRIDKSALTFSEPERIRDKAHLRYVASQPCLLCGAKPADAHHVRFAQPRAMGRKVGDNFTVPLCRNHHRELHHSGGESGMVVRHGHRSDRDRKELWQQRRQLPAVLCPPD